MEGDVLDLLGKLQQVADEIDRLQAGRRAAEEERERIETARGGAQRELAAREERAHTLDIERRKRELALKAERDRMARIKGRMGEVKTSREYQAVLAETGAAKAAITEQEEAQLRDLQELEETTAQVEGLRARIAGMDETLAEVASRTQVVIAEADQGLAACKAEEAALMKALPIDIVDRYRLIRSRRGGLAVVPARNEACTACFMRLPPQTYIEVVRRSRVVQCPNCHRILIPPAAAPAAE
ncbi:MAG: zinc ribbon domain-containing protein [Deferrisomatales bacterium]